MINGLYLLGGVILGIALCQLYDYVESWILDKFFPEEEFIFMEDLEGQIAEDLNDYLEKSDPDGTHT